MGEAVLALCWWVKCFGVKGGVWEGEVDIRLGCCLGRGHVVKGLECHSEELGLWNEWEIFIHSRNMYYILCTRNLPFIGEQKCQDPCSCRHYILIVVVAVVARPDRMKGRKQ